VDFVQAGPYGLVANPAVHDPVIGVPTVTVDELVAELQWQRVDFIKMDVEGSEVAAVRGMSGLLVRADAPTILYEANGHTLGLFGESPRSLAAQLEQFGYRSYLVEPGRLLPVEATDLQPTCTVDYLAAKRPLGSVDGWHVGSPMTPQEVASKVISSCTSGNEHDRAYIGRALATAAPSVLSDAGIIDALAALRTDASAEVRAAASWFDRRRRIEAASELLRRRSLDLQAEATRWKSTARSTVPLIGGLITWIRRNVTSHLREPYVVPTFERQMALNHQMLQVARQVVDWVSVELGASESMLGDSAHRRKRLESHLSAIEAQLDLISACLNLMEGERPAQRESARIAGLCRRAAGQRHRLTAEEE
jgi:hypothetical protein